MSLSLQWKGSISLNSETAREELDDVQFWGKATNGVLSGAKLKVANFIDPQRVPLWSVKSALGKWQIASRDDSTRQFFNTIIQTSDYDQARDNNTAVVANMGLLVEVENSVINLLMIYIEVDREGSPPPRLQAIALVDTNETETELLITKAEPETTRFLIDDKVKRQKEFKFNRLVERARSSTPVPMARQNSITSVKSEIYRKPSTSTPTPAAPSPSLSAAATPPPPPLQIQNNASVESPQERRNKAMISQVIMGEFRLRGIKRQDDEEEYKQLYSIAYKAALFAFRKSMNQPMQLDTTRDTVDKLLNVLQ